MGAPPNAIDILPEIKGVVFNVAWKNRVAVTMDAVTGPTAHFIVRDDLIASKLAAGRSQDLADVEAVLKAAAAAHGTSKATATAKPRKSRTKKPQAGT